MDDTFKYVVTAAITADGIVERSDVVGAVFGQTEGLLGEEFDLRDLQQSSRIGRLDVEVTTEGGQSFGELRIASSLDRAETAILAASIETITRIGPCHARIEVTEIEDVRKAKRRQVVERAKKLLLSAFDESSLSSDEVVDEVREAARVADVTEVSGLPAGPRVPDADALVLVEGRADVLTLLEYGIKNAVAVGGTDVPGSVSELTADRTATAFLDDDRGGELVGRELLQVADIDYVAFAPDGKSVEDLDREEALAALKAKVPADGLPGEDGIRAEVAADSPTTPAGVERTHVPSDATPAEPSDGVRPEPRSAGDDGTGESANLSGSAGSGSSPPASVDAAPEAAGADGSVGVDDTGTDSSPADDVETDATGTDSSPADDVGTDATEPGADSRTDATSLGAHVRAVIDADSGQVRLLDDDLESTAEVDAESAFEAIADADPVPFAVVIDGKLTQRILDVAAQRGVEHAVARSTGEFVKRPVGVRVRTAEDV